MSAPHHLNLISLGAGVQSSTMALMAAHGEITPMPDAAIFADVGAEPRAVYEWLDWLEQQLPFPVYRVSAGNLRDNVLESIEGGRFAGAPFFTETAHGSEGRLRRQCTREFKLAPLHQKVRELVGLKPRQRGPSEPVVTQWIGISLDEMQRMKDSGYRWIQNRFPLVDQKIHRWKCIEWMKANGYPEPPRSACTFCPYHNNAEWRRMRDHDPEAWEDALEVDRAIRNGVRGTQEKLYLHRSLTPLDQVDLSTSEDHGQQSLSFDEECDGMCGV